MSEVWVVTRGDKHEGGDVQGVFEDFDDAKACGMLEERCWELVEESLNRFRWLFRNQFVLIERFEVGIDRKQVDAAIRKSALAKLTNDDLRVLGLKRA